MGGSEMGPRCQSLLGCCLDSTTGSQVVAVDSVQDAETKTKGMRYSPSILTDTGFLLLAGWLVGSGEDADETTTVHGGFFFFFFFS